jgi:hypothetical protein
MTAPPDQMGELPVWNDKRCSPQLFHRILAERGLRAAYPYRRNVWQFLDTRRRCGLQLVASISDLPPWDFGAPLRQHLHWILQEGGMRLTHASTLGLQGVGVLFLGNAGAGKSGITLAGLSIGLKTVGDDYVAVSAGDKVGARCVFAIIKQDRFGLSHVPELAARCAALPENWKGKVEIDPSHFYPDAFASELEIVACVVPRVAGVSSPRVSECGRGAAMRTLMRSNLHQFPGEEENGMQFFGGILRRLPIYSIELSTDFEKNGQAVKALIESL